MPSYITSPQPVQLTALYPGDRKYCVNNAATDSGVTTTVQFAVGPTPGNGTVTLMIVNSTNQQAQGQYSPDDSKGSTSYEPLSGCIIPPASSLAYNLQGGWMNFTFGTAPTSGNLVVTR
jgi:hypothetical protein